MHQMFTPVTGLIGSLPGAPAKVYALGAAAYLTVGSKIKCKMPSIPAGDMDAVKAVASKLIDELTSFITTKIMEGTQAFIAKCKELFESWLETLLELKKV